MSGPEVQRERERGEGEGEEERQKTKFKKIAFANKNRGGKTIGRLKWRKMRQSAPLRFGGRVRLKTNCLQGLHTVS